MSARCLRSVPLLAAMLLAAAPAASRHASAADGDGGGRAVDMLQSVLPAVVNIASWHIAHDGAASGQWTRVFGSGFVIDPNGTIITNRHVVEGAAIVAVTFADGREAVASIAALGGALDLAMLHVDVQRPLPALRFGDSHALRIGDPVFTIGNPLGVGTSVGAGIVSALNRNLRMSPYDELIQTDAAINHGDSGGPMVDRNGEVIGVDTALVSPTRGFVGLGFAIPSNDVAFVIGRLRRYGAIRAGWIGVELQDLTAQLAMALGMDTPQGAVVVTTDPGQPAALAGLDAGDVIASVDGAPTPTAREVLRAIARIAVGTDVTLAVLRDGVPRTMQVPVAVYPGDLKPNAPPPERATLAAIAAAPNFGITFGPLTPAARDHYGITRTAGALVSSVDPDSAGGAAGLVPGNVIVQVDDTPVADPPAFERAATAARKRQRIFVALLVEKKDGLKWVPVLAHPPPVPR
jgi:serine protease Do